MPSNRIEIPFAGESREGKNIFLNSEKCINYYPEIMNEKIILRGSSGLVEVADTGTNQPIRASIVFEGFTYHLSGDKLYRVDTNYNVATMSGVSIDVGNDAYLIENSLQIGIFGGAKGYVYTKSTDTITEITDTAFPGASSAVFQDGYGIVTRPGTAQFFISALNDFTTWDALDFTTAGWKTDLALRVFSDHRNLLVIGSISTQPYYNTGAAGDFPFSIATGAEQEVGIAATKSIAKGNDALFWLANDEAGNNNVMMSAGNQPRVISSNAITEKIKSYSKISDAIGLTYYEGKHVFYELIFPTADASFCFDATMPPEIAWSERQSRRIENNRFVDGRHRINTHVFYNNKNLFGDYANGKIYEMSRDAYDEDGVDLIATRVSQPLKKNQDLLTFHELHILFTPGVGITTGDAEDMTPYALLSWSDDGGYTFGNEIELQLGKLGEYKNRAIAYMLGQARNRLFKIRISAAVNRDLFEAYAMITRDSA